MSAPLLTAAMLIERRAARPARNRRLVVRIALAAVAAASVLAFSAPAAPPPFERASVQWAGGPTLLLRFAPPRPI